MGKKLWLKVAAVQGAHGLGLRSHREPARSNAHAHESRGQPGDPDASEDIRDIPLDLYSCLGRRAVGHRCGNWARQPCAALAATSPEAVGLIILKFHHERNQL